MLNLNAADTSNPEIRTEYLSNEILGNNVEVNRSSEPGMLEQKDNANLDGADTKEIKSRKLDKAPDNNAEAQELIEMISSDKDGYKKSLSFGEKLGAFLKSIFVFTFKNASGAQFKDVLAKKNVEFFVNQLSSKKLLSTFFENLMDNTLKERDPDKTKNFVALLEYITKSDRFYSASLVENFAYRIELEDNFENRKILGNLLNTTLNHFCGVEIEKIKKLTSDTEYIPSKGVLNLLQILNLKDSEKLRKATNFDYKNLLNVLYKNIENYLIFSANGKSKMKDCCSLANPPWSPAMIFIAQVANQKLEQKDYTPIISKENFEKLGKVFEKCTNDAFDKVIDKVDKEMNLESQINELDEKKEAWENTKSEWKFSKNAGNFENRTKIASKIKDEFHLNFIDKIQDEIAKTFFNNVEKECGVELLSKVNPGDDPAPWKSFVIVDAMRSSKYFFGGDIILNVQDFVSNMKDAYEASKAQQSAPDNNAEAQELIEMISSDKEGYKKSLSFWGRFSAFLKSIFVFTFKNASGAQFKDVLAKKRIDYFVNQLKDKNLFENFCKDTVSRISQEQDSEKAGYLAAFIGIVIDNGYVEIDADRQNVSKQYLNFVQNLTSEIRRTKDSPAGADKGKILGSLLIKTLNRASSEGKFGDLIENLVKDLLPYWINETDKNQMEDLRNKIEDFKCLINSDYLNIPGLIEYLADKIESSSNERDIKILGDLLRTALLNSYGEEIEKIKNLKPGDEYVPSKELGELMHYFYRSDKHVWQELKKLTGIAPDDLLQKMYKSAENYLMFEVKSKSEMENCLSFIEPCTFSDASRFVEIGKQKLERKEYAPIISKENFEKLGKAFEKCVNDAFGRVIDEKMKKLDEAKKEKKQKWEAIKAEWDNEETAHTFEKRSEVYVNIRKNLDEDFIDSLQKEIEKTFLGFMKDGSDLPNIIGFERDLEALAIIGALCTSKFFLTFEGEMNVQYFATNILKAYEASKAQQSAGGAEIKTE